jgi:60 kDa SS-A/Ro ribonucleoprotein
MAQRNKKNTNLKRTYEGGIAAQHLSNYEKLERVVMCSLLWEDSFYVDGESSANLIMGLIQNLIGTGQADKVIDLMLKAKIESKLRHTPLLMLCILINHSSLINEMFDIKFKEEDVASVITRADEPAEVLALYQSLYGSKDKLRSIPRVLIKGINIALRQFDEYQLDMTEANNGS